MVKLVDCVSFSASVEDFNSKFYVIVSGLKSFDGCEVDNRIVRQKDFGSKKACMDFIAKWSNTDYKFDEDDFNFVSHRYIPIDYLRCGVDFDED